MKRFKDYRLRTKQAIVLGTILVLMASAELFLMYRMTVIKAQIDTITTRWLPTAVAIASIKSSASELRNMQLQHAIALDDSTQQRLARVMVGLIDRIERNQDDFERLIDEPEQRSIYGRFEDKWEQYQEFSFDFFALVEGNRAQEAVDLLTGDAEVAFNDFSAVLDTLVMANETASASAAARTGEMYERAHKFSHIILTLAVLIAIAAAVSLSRLISRPVAHLAEAAGKVAGGNIDVELDVLARDEIGDLSRSFNQMTASLRRARDQIMSHQRELEAANEALADKNADLEEAMRLLRRTQQQLVMREKMASLGNLVAGVAHEINNPVGAVKSAADTSARSIDVVRRTLEDATDLDALKSGRRFQAALDILRSNNEVTLTASERIAEIVKSLKNFARLDEAEFQDANIHEGLDSTLRLLHHRFKNRVEVEKHYGDIPRISCYPNQLNQVFMNLLSNSEQAIGEKGTVSITTRRNGANVEIEIADDGKGIQSGDLERIFDPGFTTKGVGVGTGLGLSITYNIIQQHSGDITVASEPGRGTTFKITLPIKQD